jgi:hypothetical protein
MAAAQTRPQQVALIEDPLNRDIWLAGELDGQDVHMAKLTRLVTRLLLAAVGILVSTTTTSIMLLLTWAGGT